MPARPELEQQLRQLHRSGELRRCAGAALDAYGPELLGYLHAVLRDEQAAFEVFAMASEDIWRSISGFRWEASFRTWAYTIVRHAELRYRADPFARRGRPLSEIAELSELQARVRTRTRPYLRSEIKRGVAALREQLSPDEQALLVLRIDRGLEWREIATILAPEESDPTRFAALCRKRFERTTARLRRLALDAGLIRDDDE